MADGEDFDGVSEVVEAEAGVADAEPELGRADILESLTSPSPVARRGPGCGGRWAGRWRGTGPWAGLSRRSSGTGSAARLVGFEQGLSHAVEVFGSDWRSRP